MIERKKPRKRKPRIGHRRVSGIKVYENHHSNTPRSRGGISKALEKYTTLAQDASSNGDRILAENFFQYAEHYQRLLNEGVGFDIKKNNNNNFENSHKKLEEVKPSRTQRAIDGKKQRLTDINVKEDKPTDEKEKKVIRAVLLYLGFLKSNEYTAALLDYETIKLLKEMDR